MDLKAPYEEVALIARLKLKDHSAFSALYDKYSPALYTVVLQMIHNKQLVNNIMHKVFITIWNTIENYDPEKGKLFTWMLQIARNAAINETKPLLNRKDLEQDLGSRVDGAAPATKTAIEDRGLKTVINKLGHEQKNLVNLCYFKGLTIDEIAETVSIPEGIVKTKIKTALSELGELIMNI